MAAVSKIENGVVELRTDVGRLYVCPTQWQRLYLRWTFRNFHSLPQQILNRRQKRLIERLSRTALFTAAEPVPSSAIIGIVENMRVLGLPSVAEPLEPATKTKPAVPTGKVAVLHGRAEDAGLAGHAERAPADPVRIPEVVQQGPAPSPPCETEKLPAPSPQLGPRRRGRRLPWAVAAVGATLTAALVLAFWLAPLWKLPQITIAPAPAPAAPPLAAALAPQPKVAPAKRVTLVKPGPAAESAAGQPAAKTGISTAAVPDLPNLPQIAEAPRSGFIYPVAPNPNLVGKVALKAVVGSDGTVKEVEVLSGDRTLAAAAVRAVKLWRYAPAQVGGRTVEAQTRVTISFLGDDAVSITVPNVQ
jgi:TonB family protein